MPEPHTDTEDALEENYGVAPSLPYALRADQLADGTFRYALENVATNEVIAEGVHADNTEALEQFRQSLRRSPLSPQEVAALEKAIAQYEHAAG